MTSIQEKATSFVLGSLSGEERDSVARERLYNRELDAEIRQIEQSLSILADDDIGVDKTAGKASVGDALWDRINDAVVRERNELDPKFVEECSDGNWIVVDSRIECKALWSEDAMLIRCAPGAFEEAHDQPLDQIENIIVIAGDVYLGGRKFVTGDYIRIPAGTTHGRMETEGGCLLFREYVALN